MYKPNARQQGFTLIELAIVIAILGILAAVAIPRFVDLQTSATEAAKDATVGAVQSAFAITVAKQEGYPTVTQLADNVQASEGPATADGKGVQVTIDGTDYIVNTYTDADCSSATGSASDTVKCVKGITKQ